MNVDDLLSVVESKSKKASLKHPLPKKADESFDNVMDSISQNWSQDTNKEIEKLKKELLAAQEKVKILKAQKSLFTKNEEKILNAIRSESLRQNTSEPQISSRVFRTTYKVSSDYFRKSLDSLITGGVVERIETKFAGKVPTYRWRIIELT